MKQNIMLKAHLLCRMYFSDNMMLQADEDITVWGTGVPNDTVTVTLKEKDAETAYEANCTIAEDDTWEVTLDAKECGGDYTMTVKCGEKQGDIQILSLAMFICLPVSQIWSMVELD